LYLALHTQCECPASTFTALLMLRVSQNFTLRSLPAVMSVNGLLGL
jgi:citrate synthase